MQAINDRMKTERQRDAKEFRAKGQQEAQNIRATADKEATIIIAEAEKNAQITRGEGDKEAVRLWNKTVGQDVEFYDFYRSLDAYRKSLSDNETSLVLSPDSDFFKFFNKGMN
jgi:membrane protease subunit HflC